MKKWLSAECIRLSTSLSVSLLVLLSASLLAPVHGSCQTTQNKELKVGDMIPAFSLPDQDGQLFSSSGTRGIDIIHV